MCLCQFLCQSGSFGIQHLNLCLKSNLSSKHDQRDSDGAQWCFATCHVQLAGTEGLLCVALLYGADACSNSGLWSVATALFHPGFQSEGCGPDAKIWYLEHSQSGRQHADDRSWFAACKPVCQPGHDGAVISSQSGSQCNYQSGIYLELKLCSWDCNAVFKA